MKITILNYLRLFLEAFQRRFCRLSLPEPESLEEERPPAVFFSSKELLTALPRPVRLAARLSQIWAFGWSAVDLDFTWVMTVP